MKKRPVARKPPAAQVVPALAPCPVCGMPVQSGKGPHKLAWHDCEFVLSRSSEPTTIDDVRSVVLRKLADRAEDATPAELASMLKALDGAGGGSSGGRAESGPSPALAGWLRDTA